MIRAKKGCRFAGKNYAKGEYVPEAAIDTKAIGALLRMRIIERVEQEVNEAVKSVEPTPQPEIKIRGRRQGKSA